MCDLTCVGHENATAPGVGRSLTSGDMNDDGVDDLIVGAVSLLFGFQFQGAVYVVYGSNTTTRPAEAFINDLADGTSGFRVNGTTGSSTGIAVATLDTNNDGKLDLLIGAPYSYNQAGACYVVYGSDCVPPPIRQVSATSLSFGNIENGTCSNETIVIGNAAEPGAASLNVTFETSATFTDEISFSVPNLVGNHVILLHAICMISSLTTVSAYCVLADLDSATHTECYSGHTMVSHAASWETRIRHFDDKCRVFSGDADRSLHTQQRECSILR